MTELIGDICEPSYLTVPTDNISGTGIVLSGTIVLSGSKLYFSTGSTWEKVTSAVV